MSKILVVYFSATGITEKVAEKIAKNIGGDLFKIEPLIPYTKEDLDWENDNSRSSIEMQDKESRPEIKNKVDNINDYDTIFLGFPIWWYIAPTIINTFLESYDLSYKLIIPFATSGSSSMGSTNQYLKKSIPNSTLIDGTRFASNVTEEEISSWILNINKTALVQFIADKADIDKKDAKNALDTILDSVTRGYKKSDLDDNDEK